MIDDFDVSDFEPPKLDESLLEAISNLVIDESPTAAERVTEDIENLIDAVGMDYIQTLNSYLIRDDVADSICDFPEFRRMVARRIIQFRDSIANIIDLSSEDIEV